jgi:hypothetical protein
MFNPQELLLKILTIIGYSDNKEEFVNQFIVNIHLQAFLDLILTLPIDRQEEIKLSLARSSQYPDRVTRILVSYFSQVQIQDAFEAASKDSIGKYIEAISDTLSNQQRQELSKIFEGRLTT